MFRPIKSHRLASACLVACFSIPSASFAQDAFDPRNLPEKLLEYTIGCALPQGASAQIAGVPYQGSLGLAPEWLDTPLNRRERDLLSSCLLARTNAFGVSVEISLRGRDHQQTTYPSLKASADERERFSLFEGAFYGDLFSDYPLAYVCVGDAGEQAMTWLKQKQRVCSLASKHSSVLASVPGMEVSWCGFVITGYCHDEDVFRQNGREFPDPIFVYLEPPID